MKPIRSAEPKHSPVPDPGFDTDALVAAAQDAVRAALARHKALGHRVVTWRDGQVVLLRPENINL